MDEERDRELLEAEHLKQEQEQTSRAKATAERTWGTTVLVWAGASAAVCIAILAVVSTVVIIKYIVPAVKKWTASNSVAADQMPGLIADLRTTVQKGGNGLETLGTEGGAALKKVGDVGDAVKDKVIPSVDKELGALTGATNNLSQKTGEMSDTVNKAVAHLDAATTGADGLLPAATALLNKGTLTIGDINKAAMEMLQEGLISEKTFNGILGNPNIPRTLNALANGVTNLSDLAAQLGVDAKDLDAAIQNFGELIDDYDKYTKTANKFHKWVLLAQIINLLGGLPRP